MTNQICFLFFSLFFQIRHDGSNSYRLMQLGCLDSVANSTVAYSSTSPLTYSANGTDFTSPYFSTNHQYTPLHHQSFHYEFQHSHPAVNPDAYSLNSLHHSQQYYQQIHHGEPADFINLHNARSLKSSCLDEQRRELGCLEAYRRHDLSLMSHGSQYGIHPDQRILPGPNLGLQPPGSDDIQVKLLLIIISKFQNSALHVESLYIDLKLRFSNLKQIFSFPLQYDRELELAGNLCQLTVM